jgi:hypothetical protein
VRIEDSEFNNTHSHALILKAPKKSHSLGMHSLKHLVLEAEESQGVCRHLPLVELSLPLICELRINTNMILITVKLSIKK